MRRNFFQDKGNEKTSRITCVGGENASLARPSHRTSMKMKQTAQ